jgi:hypothetical protein
MHAVDEVPHVIALPVEQGMTIPGFLEEDEEAIGGEAQDEGVWLINLVSHRLASKKSHHEDIC